MNQEFKVCIHYENDYGSIAYDPTTKICTVVLANATKKQEIEKYLSTPKTIQVASGETIRDFVEQTGLPTDNLEFFKNNLTRMWNSIAVLVDWSHPVA
jgi:hypothetical protein